jgi:aldose sugar dehydrogenase
MKRTSLNAALRASTWGTACAAGLLTFGLNLQAQTLVDPSLTVSTVVGGLNQPIAMAFIGRNDILVTEKASGKVQRVTNGAFAGTVIDLAVNSNSERGLLGIALHPRFPRTPWVYLYHTESLTGADSNVAAEVPLMGNRVDRYVWDGSVLNFDKNIIKLRSFQNDRNNVANPALPVLRGNHNGGVLRFGPDRKLYIIIGDNGRRGFTQNNLLGPAPDDDFGGPAPDDAHLTGVILRLNDDGSTPRDNPFYKIGLGGGGGGGDADGDGDGDDRRARDADDDGDDDDDDSSNIGPITEEVRKNVQRIFAYGVRNSFGMAFDPKKGRLWTTENGGRAFDEINLVRAGFNGGWVQSMGPISRVAEFKQIEISVGFGANGPAGLQQMRFLPTRIADTPADAKARMLRLPHARQTDPQFSWKQVVPPAALGFIHGDALGKPYNGDLIVGSAVARPTNPGHLYRFRLNHKRNALVFTDPRLQDKVADNLVADDSVTEGEELLFGSNFGIVTHIETGADGALYLVSPSGGNIRKISKR